MYINKRKKAPRFIHWLPAITWMAVIFLLSSQTYSQQDLRPWLKEKIPESVVKEKLSDVKVHYAGSEISIRTKGASGFLEFFIRKGAHIFVFMTLAVFVQWAVMKTWVTGKWSYLITFLLVFLYALSDEWHQSYNMERTAKIQDVGIDAIGIGLGIMMVFMIQFISACHHPNFVE